jgi:hypothetical protein
MDGDLESKRDRWKQRTDKAFERMCAGKSAAELVTMDEREEMAMVLAKEMAAFLLEENIRQDPAAAPPRAACCPRCGGEATAAPQPEDPMPERVVTTRAGDVALRRQRWRCGKCRILLLCARHVVSQEVQILCGR